MKPMKMTICKVLQSLEMYVTKVESFLTGTYIAYTDIVLQPYENIKQKTTLQCLQLALQLSKNIKIDNNTIVLKTGSPTK